MAFKLLLLLEIFACISIGKGSTLNETNKKGDSKNVILIILGGFRWDYLNMHLNSSDHGFKHIIQHGGRAKYIEPVFPATTLPNLQTIVTGKYPEQHGIVDNYMYDRSTWRNFSVDVPNDARQPEWWGAAEPIWVTARNHNLSYVYTADEERCNLPWGDLIPAHCGTLRQQIQMALDCIEKDSCNIFMMNTGAVEAASLHHGPGSREVRAAVKDVDRVLTLLWKDLTSKGLEYKTNIVLVSDHGITSTDPSDVKELSLDACVDWSTMVATVGCGGYMVLQPLQGTQIALWGALKACPQIKGKTKLAFTRLSNPEYHYSHNYRILKIIVIANRGTFLQCPNISAALGPSWQGSHMQRGIAGYDNTFGENPDMRGVLMVTGPAFRSGALADGVHQVDVHSLLCTALDLSCPDGDANITRVSTLLINPPQPEPVVAASVNVHPDVVVLIAMGISILYSKF